MTRLGLPIEAQAAPRLVAATPDLAPLADRLLRHTGLPPDLPPEGPPVTLARVADLADGRRLLADGPLVALTDPADGRLRAALLEAGALEAVAWPGDEDEIAARIQRARLVVAPGRNDAPQATVVRSILDVSSDCIKVVGLDGRLDFMSEGGQRVMEVDDVGRVLGQVWVEFWPENERPKVQAALQAARAGGVGRFRGTAPTAKGNPRVWDVTVAPLRDGTGDLTAYLSVSRDVTREDMAETGRRDSDERFRALADSAPVMIWASDATHRCTYINAYWTTVTGLPADRALGSGFLDLIHPDDRPAFDAVTGPAMARREPFVVEYRLRDSDGDWRWMLDTAAPRLRADGSLLGYVGTVVDISGRKRDEELRRLMMNELNHRVKNTLATVQSLAAQSFRMGRVDPAVRESFEARLRSLSGAHDVLTAERWEGADLTEVVTRALDPFGSGSGGRFHLAGPNVRLTPKEALALTMTLHELATNAAKYGALSAPGGEVCVGWRADPSDGSRLEMVWAEGGGPPVETPTRRGFGTRLIERGLSDELEGEVTMEFAPEGLTCRLLLPLAGRRA